MHKFSLSRAALLGALVITAFSVTGNGKAVAKAATDSGEYVITSENESSTVASKISEEEALEGFMLKGAKSKNSPRVRNSNRRTSLRGLNVELYDEVKKAATEIANGNRSSSEVTVTINVKELLGSEWKDRYTAADLGVSTLFGSNKELTDAANTALCNLVPYDPSLIVGAVVTDNPYEFYWFGNRFSYSSGVPFSYDYSYSYIHIYEEVDIEISLCVSANYSVSGQEGTFSVDTNKCKAVVSAANNANSIIAANASKSDYEKLKAYNDAICELNEYNDYAAKNKIPYGNPWQMIYVFDGDPTTNVVCEGYSKAFKYLCDGSTFSSNLIECYTITGELLGSSGSGGHMWNHVRMDDGKYYLVDVTNNDTGSVGYPYKLFLTGLTEIQASSQYHNYTLGVGYFYDSNTRSLYTAKELALSATDYQVPSNDENQNEALSYEIEFRPTFPGGIIKQGEDMELVFDLMDDDGKGHYQELKDNIEWKWEWIGDVPFSYATGNPMQISNTGSTPVGDYTTRLYVYLKDNGVERLIDSAEFVVTVQAAQTQEQTTPSTGGDQNPPANDPDTQGGTTDPNTDEGQNPPANDPDTQGGTTDPNTDAGQNPPANDPDTQGGTTDPNTDGGQNPPANDPDTQGGTTDPNTDVGQNPPANDPDTQGGTTDPNTDEGQNPPANDPDTQGGTTDPNTDADQTPPANDPDTQGGTTDPNTDEGQNPPANDPDTQGGTTDPNIDEGQNPPANDPDTQGGTTDPNTEESQNPSVTNPSTEEEQTTPTTPVTNPSTEEGQNTPATDPAAAEEQSTPAVQPSQNQDSTTDNTPINTTEETPTQNTEDVLPPDGKITAGNVDVQVNASGNATVAKETDKSVKKVSIGSTVEYNGQVFKVTAIEANAYKNCKNLTSVNLGSNLEKIASGAFKGCKNLKKITIKANNLKSVGSGSFKGIKKGCKITITCKDKKKYDKLVKMFKKAGAKNAKFVFKKG
ncbi:leucine-rich repeat protein [Butyrivibrio sp. VCD2006]|uniref:leucine-rich repeat protein n=1 Tax=Butyrivibrio sp. VCD2006 TaxID=1280664 RepID=UPI000686ED59|nr:leucine-rich repeat protein [Butyrivibrio sp. VCD2006]